ncbi:hypothetical protein A2U01_0060316, partial [Trifolium medium]|nr:hypothetical protein [Trifolium medium]
RFRQIAASQLRCGELAEGSRVRAAVAEMYSVANYAFCYRMRGGGGGAAAQ